MMARLINLIASGEVTTFSIGLEKGDPTKVQIIACGGAWQTTQTVEERGDAGAIMSAVQRSLGLFEDD